MKNYTLSCVNAYLPYVIIIIIVMLLNITLLYFPYKVSTLALRERFANPPSNTTPVIESVTLRDPEKIYDKFYAQIYEKIIGDYTDYRVTFECKDLYREANLKKYTSNAKILDVGCGIGSHVAKLASSHKSFFIYGVDMSEAMLNIAKQKTKDLSNVRLIQGDVHDTQLFGKNDFTHLTCYYFSIYYTRDLDLLLKNIHTWLKPQGYFAVHLVDKFKFDPVLDASNPFPAFSFQKYSERRKNTSTIHFEKFVYESEFKLGKENEATFIETFKYPDRNYVRTQRHQMYMPNIKEMVNTITSHGFKLIHTTHMTDIAYEYQYICYFQKES